jgi:hypothetical protein
MGRPSVTKASVDRDPATSERGPGATTPALNSIGAPDDSSGPFVLVAVEGLPGVYRQVVAAD